MVALADSLIRHNYPAGREPRLVAMQADRAGEVTIVQWPDLDTEASGIADAVQWLTGPDFYVPRDILVLTSRRTLGYRIRNHIRAKGIPVHSFYHEEPLESEAAQRGFCLLTLLACPDDRVALRWWLGAGDRHFRARAYATLRQLCERSGRSIRQVLDDVVDGPLRVAGLGVLPAQYLELKRRLAALDFLSLSDLVDALFPEGDEDCSFLRETARLSLDKCETAADLLDHVRTQITQPETPEEGDFVRVMSLHKSKGLTSKVTKNVCQPARRPDRRWKPP
jgi:ATP-dependent exoDNAse (exonuclease V) beta subunit